MVNEGGAGRTRVLLTGATGYIAGQLLPEFRERYDLRLTDAREETSSGERVDGVEVVDLLSDDDSKLGPLFDWADVVVHCGHLKPQGEDLDVALRGRTPKPGHDAADLQALHGAWCAPGGSGEHQPGGQVVREPVLRRPQGPRGPRGLPAPGLLLRLGQGRLGAARASCTPAGRWAASSRSSRSGLSSLGRSMPRTSWTSRRERYVRELAGYISERDLRQLFCRSVETPDLEDEYGVPFHIFYGGLGQRPQILEHHQRTARYRVRPPGRLRGRLRRRHRPAATSLKGSEWQAKKSPTP